MNGLTNTHEHTSRFDNVHVLLWLIKDTCWMLQWKILGCVMIAPTISVAIYLAVRSKAEDVFWINVAICFWISANAYWMVCEFVGREDIKDYAGLPFALGFIAVAIFYLRPQPRPLAQ
ncbi:MAG TPA: hypothetical protein VN700_17265 [Vicinamibacterales bacterium]|nr:hypothetical protein [Vicinamibacterales bacterium]